MTRTPPHFEPSSGHAWHGRVRSRTPGFSAFAAGLLLLMTIASPGSAAPPTLDQGINAWLQARSWLDANDLPSETDPHAEVTIDALDAISVLLRMDGRVIGRGFDPSGDPLALRRAVGRALAQTSGDRAIRGLPAALQDEIIGRLTLEIEFAGTTEPLLGSTLAAATGRLQPGIDGIAVRRGTMIARSLPGRELATGTAGASSSIIFRLLDEVGLPPRDLPELRRLDQVSLHRFDTLRLGQSKADGLPRELFRSGPFVSRSAPDVRVVVDDLRGRIAAHLIAHRPPASPEAIERPSLLGDFDPIANRHLPFEAPVPDRLLVAWALASNASIDRGEVADEVTADAGEMIAAMLLDELPSTAGDDPVAVDLGILTASALQDRDRMRRFLDQAQRTTVTEDPVGIARRAAALGSLPTDLVDDDTFQAKLDEAWQANNSIERLIASFEWLSLAELARFERTGEPSPRVAALQATRDALLLRQIEDPGSDLDGGLPLRSGARTLVDARTLRPALGTAALDRIPQGDEQSLIRARKGLEGYLRFTRQLMVSEPDARLLPGWRQAANGLRTSPWASQQSLAADATALLFLCQMRSTPIERP
ncbi:MAG: hypothetical protein P8J59_01230 [Phycisphaerales bacterium]|nr:hypothetical protein [Phycisphaerales bacterium]